MFVHVLLQVNEVTLRDHGAVPDAKPDTIAAYFQQQFLDYGLESMAPGWRQSVNRVAAQGTTEAE